MTAAKKQKPLHIELANTLADLEAKLPALEASRVSQLELIADTQKAIDTAVAKLAEDEQKSLRVTGTLPGNRTLDLTTEDNRRQIPLYRQSLVSINSAIQAMQKDISDTRAAITRAEDAAIKQYSLDKMKAQEADLLDAISSYTAMAARFYGHGAVDASVLVTRLLNKARSDGKLQTARDKAEKQLRGKAL